MGDIYRCIGCWLGIPQSVACRSLQKFSSNGYTTKLCEWTLEHPLNYHKINAGIPHSAAVALIPIQIHDLLFETSILVHYFADYCTLVNSISMDKFEQRQ